MKKKKIRECARVKEIGSSLKINKKKLRILISKKKFGTNFTPLCSPIFQLPYNISTIGALVVELQNLGELSLLNRYICSEIWEDSETWEEYIIPRDQDPGVRHHNQINRQGPANRQSWLHIGRGIYNFFIYSREGESCLVINFFF